MTAQEAAALLETKDNILVLCHKQPDGDTVGSAAGLCRALLHKGKTAHVFQDEEEVPALFKELLLPLYAPAGFAPEYVVAVDIAETSLFPKGADLYKDRTDLVVDHHKTNGQYGRAMLVDVKAAAVGEIVFDIVAAMGVPLIPEIAEAIYIAVATDTGCFRYENTREKSHVVAARCFAAGIDAASLNQRLFATKTRARFMLERRLYENMELFAGGRLAVSTLSPSDIEEAGVLEGDMDNLSSLTKQLEGVLLGVTIIEKEAGVSRISARSTAPVDAAELCFKFGGGGHVRAAGASLALPAQRAKEAILPEALLAVGGHG